MAHSLFKSFPFCQLFVNYPQANPSPLRHHMPYTAINHRFPLTSYLYQPSHNSAFHSPNSPLPNSNRNPHPAPPMSRPASESLGAVKRTRTASLCAESVDPPYSREHLPYPPPLPPPPAPPAPRTNPRKRLRPLPALADNPSSHPTFDLTYRSASALHYPHSVTEARPAPGPRRSAAAARPEPRNVRQPAPRLAPAVYSLPCDDDDEGHLIYKLGQGLHPSLEFPNGRYKILSELGEGTFGKVVECWDRRLGQRVAIKVVRSVAKYREAAKLEIDVLLHLNRRDPDGLYHCVKLYSWFDYRKHVCMVFEKLGPSLYEQLRRNRFQPFPLEQVREYAFQLLESVNFVHNLTLIHTDLKPENILLENAEQSNTIKLIDFGSATFEKQHHSAVISTRHYRAPEVILGLGWTYPCDLWSVGCILVELYTGQALFQTHENLEHLAMMSCVLGPIPDSMIRRADGSSQKYFSRQASGRKTLNWPAGASSKASIRSVCRVRSLKDIIRCPAEAHELFFDLVARLLSFEPDTRCTSAEALKHPFFRENTNESDRPLTTPTLSSRSSDCGSNAGNGSKNNNASRGRYRGSSRRKSGAQQNQLPSARRMTRRGRSDARQMEDEGDDTATEMPTAAEHSDHTIVAVPISPRHPVEQSGRVR